MFDFLHKFLLRKHLVDEVSGVRFYATGRIHKYMAWQISANSTFDPPLGQINVFVGAHRWVKKKLPKSDFNIGIQTEQFFDQRGERLWGLTDEGLPDRLASHFSHVLDLDQNNRKAYAAGSSNKVTFGPFIFPSRRVAYVPGEGGELIFVGAMNERRAERLDKLKTVIAVRLISKLYNRELEDEIRSSSGLINIHFNEGTYTEWPRVLLAYLCGKVLFSEELASPMIAGRHYIPLSSARDAACDEALRETIFSQIQIEIVEKFEFATFLNELAGETRPINAPARVH